jgi:hypothetical protein
MNLTSEALVAIVAAAFSVIVQVAGIAYVYGKLTSKVSTHDKFIAVLDAKVDEHETRISHIEGAQELVH